ncbi:hypothetical protein NDU88_004434 [Pleurodeles waltl]|uniref:Uncharacterized protein n=1 Tax=Pleurodeles waltl TaxID=8319 RepID=A0AAV7W9Q4_PLEWA|nr:hypothetical protein NDU88_004434 [Pleurodeles waltl]
MHVPTWRLQPTLLHDRPIRAELAECIDSSYGVVTGCRVGWSQSGGKCACRWRGVRHTLTRELQNIDVGLREVERGVASDGENQGRLIGLKKKWAEVDSRLWQFDYQQHIARLHSEGDRSSRLLAWFVKGEQQHTPISAIRLDSGTIVNTQLEINEAFRQYYSTLYVAYLNGSIEAYGFW